jgi:predicted nucleic acid-binding protein
MDYHAVKVHYFDASALVKLVADDVDEAPGRDVLRKYFRQHAHPGYTTSFCIAEAFGAFKLKFLRKKISQKQYIDYVRNFIRETGNHFKVNEVNILDPVVVTETERLVAKYKIDFIDCFQIVTIMQGEFRILVGPSQSILITADRELAVAARAERARVWECTSESAPV